MRAVFLDAATFSVDLPRPNGLTQWTVYDYTPNNPNVIVSRCMEYDIIVTNKIPISQTVLARLPTLKLIQVTATGLNNIDLVACKARGVLVYNVANYSKNSVPEHTLMLMLTAMRAGMYYHGAVFSDWHKNGQFCMHDTAIFDLAGKTLGIIGAGNIGQQVGRLALAFGMQVLWAERINTAPRDARYTPFETVLAKADVISIHCALTPDTHHLINQDTLAKMHQKPLIINMARGAIVCSQDIVTAVQNQQILGYATDVFVDEPPKKDDPLLSLRHHPRVFFTPHNAWASQQSQMNLWSIACRQIEAFVQNQPPSLHLT